MFGVQCDVTVELHYATVIVQSDKMKKEMAK